MCDISIDYKKYKAYYGNLYANSPGDTNLVGSWGGVDQSIRYEKLIDTDCFRKSNSFMEIGSGLGGLLDFLLQQGVIDNNSVYCGVDILEEMQKSNEKKYDKDKYPNFTFLTKNIIEEQINKKYDVVLMCGVFHLKTPNGNEYMKRLLKNAFLCCNRLLTFNFISSYVNYKDPEIEYHDPIEVFRFCVNELSTKVVVEHHYWKCDVSFKVYR